MYAWTTLSDVLQTYLTAPLNYLTWLIHPPPDPLFPPLQTGFKGQSHNVLLGFVCLFFFFIVLYNYDDVIPNLFMKNVMLKDF